MIKNDHVSKVAEPKRDLFLLPGVPSNQLVIEGRPSKLQVSPTVPTKKTTLAHSATVKARDKAYLVGVNMYLYFCEILGRSLMIG